MEEIKFLKHTADIKFQASGKTLKDVFENSFIALKKSICGDIEIKEKKRKKFEVSGNDYENLMYEFLEEFLYLLDAENFITNRVEIHVDKLKIKAEAFGDVSNKYSFTNNVKAITYSDMKIKKNKNGWMSQVVLDV